MEDGENWALKDTPYIRHGGTYPRTQTDEFGFHHVNYPKRSKRLRTAIGQSSVQVYVVRRNPSSHQGCLENFASVYSP